MKYPPSTMYKTLVPVIKFQQVFICCLTSLLAQSSIAPLVSYHYLMKALRSTLVQYLRAQSPLQNGFKEMVICKFALITRFNSNEPQIKATNNHIRNTFNIMKSYKSQEFIFSKKQSAQDRLQQLEQDIEVLEGMDYIKKIMNVQLYIRKNYDEFIKLTSSIGSLKCNTKVPEEISMKTKSKSSYQNSGSKSMNNSDRLPNNFAHQIEQILKRNQTLDSQIMALKQKNRRLSQPFEPLPEQKRLKIGELQKQVQDLSAQVNTLSKRNVTFVECTRKEDMFGEYELMIRECEGWRKTNNSLAQQLRTIILQINRLTGKEQNPNLVLINLK